uniref:HORMA domain-containing protein n=1 Tax=Loa loa TaxID=7209 RepID=A0A1I7V5Z6_LOALO
MTKNHTRSNVTTRRNRKDISNTARKLYLKQCCETLTSYITVPSGRETHSSSNSDREVVDVVMLFNWKDLLVEADFSRPAFRKPAYDVGIPDGNMEAKAISYRIFLVVKDKNEDDVKLFDGKHLPESASEGRLDCGTVPVSHKDYDAKKGDRYPTAKPIDSNILCGDSSFIGKTEKNADYMGRKGERCEVKCPTSSEILKHDGKLRMRSVSRQDFSPKKGERCEIKKPCDADIYLVMEQQKQEESVVEMEKKCCNSVCKENLEKTHSERIMHDRVEHSKAYIENWRTTYTETFYEGVSAEDFRRVIQHQNEEFKFPGNRSISRASFKMPTISTKQVQMTSTKLHESLFWQNGQVKVESQYNTDFVPKMKPCPAGELINRLLRIIPQQNISNSTVSLEDIISMNQELTICKSKEVINFNNLKL